MKLRYYETKKLISSEQFAAHTLKIAGPAGRRLVAGNEDDRLKVLEQWLGGQ